MPVTHRISVHVVKVAIQVNETPLKGLFPPYSQNRIPEGRGAGHPWGGASWQSRLLFGTYSLGADLRMVGVLCMFSKRADHRH